MWQPSIVPWVQELSLLMSLCPHEKLSSARSSHDPRWLLMLQPHYLQSRQEKGEIQVMCAPPRRTTKQLLATFHWSLWLQTGWEM